MPRPPDLLTSRDPGAGDFQETWFLEVALPDGRGLWVRSSWRRGDDGAAEVWATLFRPEAEAHVATLPLASLTLGDGSIVAIGDSEPFAVLDRARARGAVGPLRWDLALAGGAGHVHVPRSLQALGVVGRTYASAVLDLACDGVIELGGERVDARGGRGVLGHLWGARSSLVDWAWCHASGFDDPSAVLEVISVRLRVGGVVTPPLTSLVFRAGGRAWTFSSVAGLARTRGRYGANDLWFSARDGAVAISGRARFGSDATIANVRYTGPDGRPSWCRNTRSAVVEVHVDDRRAGVARSFSCSNAAFERVTTDRPVDYRIFVG